MRMYDLIDRKKRGHILEQQEIAYMISGFVDGEIPDYQMAAMLMAIYFKGMNDEETTYLTLEMAKSGDMIDLSGIDGIKVDKHSTGGVGDKTTLVVGPIVAAYGVKVAKMSGRGLGHTGGTIDKLESIPGFRTSIPTEEFFHIVNQTGIAVVGQTGNLVPADKKLYALRDVTATVDSIPLIASSIMSKKLAAGSDCIVLDVKTGSGAFMKTLEDSVILAEKMTAIGRQAGKRCCALITDMDIPLGHAIGNSLEVIEAVDTLRGKGPGDLTEVSLEIAASMLELAGKGTLDQCRRMAREAVEDGRALQCLVSMVERQGGDSRYILDCTKFEKAPYSYVIESEETGYITHMDTEACGIVSVMLGAGRDKKDDEIDMTAGIMIKKKYGDPVQKGETLAILYASDEKRFPGAAAHYLGALTFGDQVPAKKKLIYARV